MFLKDIKVEWIWSYIGNTLMSCIQLGSRQLEQITYTAWSQITVLLAIHNSVNILRWDLFIF